MIVSSQAKFSRLFQVRPSSAGCFNSSQALQVVSSQAKALQVVSNQTKLCRLFQLKPSSAGCVKSSQYYVSFVLVQRASSLILSVWDSTKLSSSSSHLISGTTCSLVNITETKYSVDVKQQSISHLLYHYDSCFILNIIPYKTLLFLLYTRCTKE